MHANPIPLQNLSALCNILITVVQRLNHWLCHPFICFLQVSVVQTRADIAPGALSLHTVYVDIPLALQFQGAFCCTVLACGWIWAGCIRSKEVRRQQTSKVQSMTQHLAARHRASATMLSQMPCLVDAKCLSRQALCAHDAKVGFFVCRYNYIIALLCCPALPCPALLCPALPCSALLCSQCTRMRSLQPCCNKHKQGLGHSFVQL